ncbi:MAG: antibiotic biosynthesis monooxygenase [Acidobacteria bacterium]|nr:antibiotic biosynthesis monooxygenase [Acidobacteriota bacterium]MBV9645704.1 antibiotic biosynthesis monooxygenase [Verrucomicrobiota bacterium]
MSTRCTVIAYFYAKPEKRRELQAILEDFVAQTRKESGCINYHLHQSDKNPDVFVFYENWATRKDWEVHNQQPFLKGFLDKKTDYLTRDIEVESYRMLSEDDLRP